MIDCPKCGESNSNSTQFCANCGASLKYPERQSTTYGSTYNGSMYNGSAYNPSINQNNTGIPSSSPKPILGCVSNYDSGEQIVRIFLIVIIVYTCSFAITAVGLAIHLFQWSDSFLGLLSLIGGGLLTFLFYIIGRALIYTYQNIGFIARKTDETRNISEAQAKAILEMQETQKLLADNLVSITQALTEIKTENRQTGSQQAERLEALEKQQTTLIEMQNTNAAMFERLNEEVVRSEQFRSESDSKLDVFMQNLAESVTDLPSQIKAVFKTDDGGNESTEKTDTDAAE